MANLAGHDRHTSISTGISIFPSSNNAPRSRSWNLSRDPTSQSSHASSPRRFVAHGARYFTPRKCLTLLCLLLFSFFLVNNVVLRIIPHGSSWTRPSLFSLSKQSLCSFSAPTDPIPVWEDEAHLDFSNHPLSLHRPQNQFTDCSRYSIASDEKPVLTVITATQNPRPNFDLTFKNVQQQSLQNFRWIIVNDHSDNPASISALRRFASSDPRITLINNVGQPGLANARNVALEHIYSDSKYYTPYIAPLDDDDLLELTAFEKAVWMLESNPQWSLASFFFIKFGAQNVTERRGVHLGVANYFAENYVSNAAVIRQEAVGDCRYDNGFAAGGEDWDFWMCLAERGEWGGTVPELAYWYRVNDKRFRQERWGDTFTNGVAQLRAKVQAKHRSFDQFPGEFPSKTPPASVALEPVIWKAPFVNRIPDPTKGKSILFILPWLYVGGADIGALRMIETFTKLGYRVTVVCTLQKVPEGLELRPQVMQWTHDVHVMPSFLRASDFPRYMKYLAESRQVSLVLFSNSMLAYEMLPALREQLPSVPFVDYLHNEAYDGWKSGGYPTYSIMSQRYLDRTITCSHHLREWMIERGHEASRVGVVKLGVDLEENSLSTDAESKMLLKDDLYSVTEDTVVLLSVARLDPQKRPLVVPEIIKNLLKSHPFHCSQRPIPGKRRLLMVMVGSGPSEEPLRLLIQQHKLDNCFLLTGVQTDTSPYYRSADIFLLPSMSEGISVAVSEAMAAGLPLVTAAAGALPEQVGRSIDADRAGELVTNTLDNVKDGRAYASAVAKLVANDALMKLYSSNGQTRVRSSDWHHTLLKLFPQFDIAKAAHAKPRTPAEIAALPHPAAQLSIQTQLLESRSFVDFASGQNALTVKPRNGVGRELQLRCGEGSDAMTGWIDDLVKPKSCDTKEPLDVVNLRRSAIQQCGYWCIWDLRTHNRVGWSYNGYCFQRMKGSTCQEHFALRPNTLIAEG